MRLKVFISLIVGTASISSLPSLAQDESVSSDMSLTCLSDRQIASEQPAKDSKSLIYRTKDGSIYQNVLAGACPVLRYNSDLQYFGGEAPTRSGRRICAGTRISEFAFLDPDQTYRNTCRLTEFRPITVQEALSLLDPQSSLAITMADELDAQEVNAP